MSRKIETEVTSLEFDARAWKRGLSDAMRSLSEFKRSLVFTDVARGFEEIDRAADSVDFSGIERNVQGISQKFSVMGAVAYNVISRVTNAVMDMGKTLANAVIFDPILTGLEEYELQINAVQTILANTSMKGTTLDDVNRALDELNEYADLTIYNFAQMTDNIGKFTAAGVDLDTSVSAIKGIANLAAVSGSNSQQASTAMYQLSQAIASGTVRLMDWNSVVNAGMGGQVFQDLLMHIGSTQEGFEDIDFSAWIQEAGGFRSSLQEGWLTSEVMLQALEVATGDMSRAQLENIGLSETLVDRYLEFGQTAQDAATKVKTFTQLMDTMAEAIQSGWAQSFRIIIGDFEEAKELFGAVSDVFGGVIEESARTRNQILGIWDIRGGRQILIHALIDAFENFFAVMAVVKDAVAEVFPPLRGGDLYNWTVAFSDLVEKFKMGEQSAAKLRSVFRGLASVLDIVFLLVGAILKPFGIFVNAAGGFGESALDMAARLGDFAFALRNALETTGFFDIVVGSVIKTFAAGIQIVRAYVQEFLNLAIMEDVVTWFEGITKSDFTRVLTTITDILKGIGLGIGAVIYGIGSLINSFVKLEAVQSIVDSVLNIDWSPIQNFFKGIPAQIEIARGKLVEFVDWFKNLGSEIANVWTEFQNTNATKAFAEMIQGLTDGSTIRKFVAEATEGLSGVRYVLGMIQGAFEWVREGLAGLGIDLSGVGAKIGETLTNIFNSITTAEGNIDFDGLAQIMNAGFAGALAMGITSALKGNWIVEAIKAYLQGVTPLMESAVGVFESLEGVFSSWQTSLKADALMKIGIAIGIIAVSAIALSMVDNDRLIAASLAVGALLSELALATKYIAGSSLGGIQKATVFILALSASLLLLSAAVLIFGKMDPGELTQGLLAVGAALGGFVATVRTITAGGNLQGMAEAGASLILLSLGLMVMAGAIKIMSMIDTATFVDGFLKVSASLLAFSAAVRLMKPQMTLSTALAITTLSGAMMVMAEAVEAMGSMSWDEIVKGLVGIAGSLAIIVATLYVMDKFDAKKSAKALRMTGTALVALAGAMFTLGSMSWEMIIKSLVLLGATILILGAAAYALMATGAIFALQAMGTAILMIGIGIGAIGLGLGFLALSLVALAGAGVALSLTLRELGEVIIDQLPQWATAFANAITNFFVTMAERSPEFFQASKTMLLGFVEALLEVWPELLVLFIEMILEMITVLVDNVPEFVDKGFEILMGFLDGIRDNIAEVTETTVEIITEFIEGLTAGIPQFVDAAFDLMEAFFTAVYDEIEERAPGVITRMGEFAENIAQGVIDGIGRMVENVKGAVADMANAAIEEMQSWFEFGSPSKVTTEWGVWIARGLINGIDKSVVDVVDSMSNFANKAQNGMQTAISRIMDIVDKDMNMSPTITPILDLTQVDGGIRALNNKNWTSLRIGGKVGSVADKEGSAEGKVVFQQYNYSPKALDPGEIYRRTKMVAGKLANQGGLS